MTGVVTFVRGAFCLEDRFKSADFRKLLFRRRNLPSLGIVLTGRDGDEDHQAGRKNEFEHFEAEIKNKNRVYFLV